MTQGSCTDPPFDPSFSISCRACDFKIAAISLPARLPRFVRRSTRASVLRVFRVTSRGSTTIGRPLAKTTAAAWRIDVNIELGSRCDIASCVTAPFLNAASGQDQGRPAGPSPCDFGITPLPCRQRLCRLRLRYRPTNAMSVAVMEIIRILRSRSMMLLNLS
jgi:hypothetical protein